MVNREFFGTMYDTRIPTSTPLVFSFDPGESTGWAIWSLDGSRPFMMYGQGLAEHVLDQFHELLQRMGPYAANYSQMVIEKFIVPAKPMGRNIDMTFASEVIGALRFIGRTHGVLPPKMQLPVERNVASDRLMRNWGWITDDRPARGRDAMSAARHLGSYLLQKNTVPVLKDVVG